MAKFKNTVEDLINKGLLELKDGFYIKKNNKQEVKTEFVKKEQPITKQDIKPEIKPMNKETIQNKVG